MTFKKGDKVKLTGHGPDVHKRLGWQDSMAPLVNSIVQIEEILYFPYWDDKIPYILVRDSGGNGWFWDIELLELVDNHKCKYKILEEMFQT